MLLDYPTWVQQHTYSTVPYKQMEYQKQHMFLSSLGRQPCPTTFPLRARRCISRRKCSQENDTFPVNSLMVCGKRKCTIFKLFWAFNFRTFAGKKQPDCGNFEVPICPQIPCGQIATIWTKVFLTIFGRTSSQNNFYPTWAQLFTDFQNRSNAELRRIWRDILLFLSSVSPSRSEIKRFKIVNIRHLNEFSGIVEKNKSFAMFWP